MTNREQRLLVSVIALSVLPFAALQSEPRDQDGGEQERNHGGGDGRALAEIAAADGALVAERRHQMRGVGGPPRVSTQMSWKSVKVNSTENVITTAMMGVS